jgi:hypothetical protein
MSSEATIGKRIHDRRRLGVISGLGGTARGAPAAVTDRLLEPSMFQGPIGALDSP